MQFVCFHLMPWPYLPDDFEARHESAWLTVPNSLYDARRGHVRSVTEKAPAVRALARVLFEHGVSSSG